LWEAYRLEYTMSSGGPGSGLYKSMDGGETWTDITRNPGLPSGIDGKIGVSISGADSNRVYAIIENENGGLFVSDDAGATWKSVNENRNLRQRAFYYTHVTADPKNRDTVYVQNVGTFKSTDGGKTMVNFAGGDSHDLWIDPDDTNHIMHASDSGGAVTYAGGGQWSARDFPTGQFYHVVTTKHVPYHVCGAQQDSSTICVPSNTGLAGGGGRGGGGAGGGRGTGAPATYGAGGAEPGYIAADPKDPDVFFAGGNNGSFMTRINRRTGENREVGVYPRMFSGEPSSALVERVQWTYPIIFSPVDPNVLYSGTQHVWKTTNGGQTWDKISGDLARHDPKTMGDSGGPITHDMNSPEVYATVFAIGPGKTDVNVIWAGSDDGLIHVTRDGGKSWNNVTPRDMPDFGRVSIIDASAFDAATAYVAVKKPLLGDLAPYIFRTHDFGKTWTKIVKGIGPQEYVHAVREDPTRKGLLYAGTQDGFYISYDDGDTWLPLSLNLSDTQVSDIAVEANDIAISTHGRGFYILDHVGPLRQYTPSIASAGAYLFKPEDAIRSAGGATISYLLREPAQSLTIDILDGKGQVIRSFTGTNTGGRAAGAPAGAGAAGQGRGGGRGGFGGGAGASMAPGLNSVSWDLRYPSATSFPGMILWGGSVTGPAAAPGTYQVRMTVNGKTLTQPLLVKKHPLYIDVTDADLKEQFDLAIQIRDKVSEADNAVLQIRGVKSQVADRLSKAASDAKLKAAGDTLTRSLSAVEEEIYQVRNQSGQDPLNFPIKLNNRLATLLSMVCHGDGKPIGNALPVFKDLTAELKVQTDKLQQVLTRDLTAFNTEAKRLSLDPVSDK
ncbi:MAG: glycosyl hydrolase, partial [Acidobacteriota bacterium]